MLKNKRLQLFFTGQILTSIKNVNLYPGLECRDGTCSVAILLDEDKSEPSNS